MKKKLFFIFFLLFCMLVKNSYGTETTFKEKIQTLVKIPEGFEIIIDSLRISSDAKHVSFVAYTDNTHKFIFYDDHRSPAYYAVKPGMPVFFKGRHAFIAYKENNGGAVVVVDGKTNHSYDNVDNFKFSANASRYAYRAVQNDKQCIVVDGKPGPWYTGIPVRNNMLFSPDSTNFAYAAVNDNGCMVVLNGKEQKHNFKFIDDLKFSLGGKRLAYKALIKGSIMQGGTQKWCVVVDGKKQNEYNKIFDLVFSRDTNHLAYSAIKDNKMVIVIDGVEKPSYDQYGLPVFANDSKHLAYTFRKNKNFYFSLNDQVNGPYDMIGKFYFSPDSSRYAYFAEIDSKWYCVVNNETETEFQNVEVFKFSPDSSRYAYGAVPSEGNAQIIVDSVPGKKYWSVGEPYFTPDSRHIIHKAQKKSNGKLMTVIDGMETKLEYFALSPYFISEDSKHLAYSGLVRRYNVAMVIDNKEYHKKQNFIIVGNPYFSPDNNYVAYHVQSDKDKWKLVVNGHLLKESYDGFMKDTPIIFDSPTKFHTIGLKLPGPEFVLIEVDIPENIKLESEIFVN